MTIARNTSGAGDARGFPGSSCSLPDWVQNAVRARKAAREFTQQSSDALSQVTDHAGSQQVSQKATPGAANTWNRHAALRTEEGSGGRF